MKKKKKRIKPLNQIRANNSASEPKFSELHQSVFSQKCYEKK